jgi:pimeloyl-ACP methyl ester carboxylesterase
VNGIESHGAWFLPAAFRLRDRGCTTWLLDRRGSGLNLDPDPGDVPAALVLLEDLRRFRVHLGDPPVHLAGLSWGGKLALAAALDRPAGTRGLILVTPGLRARVGLPLRSKAALALGLLLGGRNRIPVPIEPEMFTRTPRFLEFIEQDPLRLRRVTGRFLVAGLALERWIDRRIRELDAPVLLFLAGADRIVDNRRVLEVLAPLRPGQLRVQVREGASHSLQFDHLDWLVEAIAGFLEEARPC